MKLSKMIKVMEHFKNGREVECAEIDFDDWEINNHPCWNWMDYKYRIKKPNVTIETWLMQSTIDKEYRIIETSLVDKVVNFKKVKLIESYEVEL